MLIRAVTSFNSPAAVTRITLFEKSLALGDEEERALLGAAGALRDDDLT